MKEIELKSKVIAERCATKLALRIITVDYVLENGIKILRIIAESDEGLTIEQATALNEAISQELDNEDYIDEEYYLEVSSEGIEKELTNNNDIIKAIGKYIYIKTYEKIENLKEIYGYLKSFENETVIVEIENKGKKKDISIAISKISKIRLAVKF